MPDRPPGPREDAPADLREKVYGRRRGRRLRLYKTDLLETMLPRLSIETPASGSSLDPLSLFDAALFERTGPSDVWLEIGFGSGEHLAGQAAAHPDIAMIGCEPFQNGVANLLEHIDTGGQRNIRILPDDARPLLDALPDASIGRCFVLFPDPWPKIRHHKRRFIGPENLARLSRVLKDGAELRMASDVMGVAMWMLEHAWSHPDFEWIARAAEDWRRRPADWPQSRYEQKGIEAGRKPVFLRFRRKPRS
ncbi:tRNA (guanine-N(7)-)-methyltransferase [Skermanella stibiiresistens SB22]|uniref:tRNA (guanine-N(7)-)-methyltransferase n=1 Tax=Skermanella stibiiresistens SB22 TaxID=1385369 RepID=W9HCF1_9PROT|nr:tRNA (guanosine(46)-N7)-methyltransferase TrmB [Skermanella stibiiresistens]EWY42382.1 tRNA (guanine-N(7)-)-methyltransferase [Skermanella stibiiresistens SB22]